MTLCINDFFKCMENVHYKIYNNVDCINSGGCGFFAVELLKRMLALGCEDARIRVYDPNPENNLSELETNLRTNGETVDSIYTWNYNDVWFSHIVVEWNGFVWDAEECAPINIRREWEGHEMLPGSISMEIMEALSASNEGWNSLYNRCQDDIVRQILDESFAMLDKGN